MTQIPGSGVVGFGFNILGQYGLGAVTSQIFKHDNPKASEWTYQPTGIEYDVPDNLSVRTDTSTAGSTITFSSREQFQSHFSEKAGIHASYGAFSGEFDAAYSETFSSDKSFYYGLHEAAFSGWQIAVENQSPSWLSPGFTSDPDVKNLPSTFSNVNQDQFFAVFRKFGTHFVDKVTVGGSFYYCVAVDKSFSSSEQQVTANIKLEYDAVFVSGSAKSKTEWNQLGKNWSESRQVRIRATGGDTSSLNGLDPDFGDNDASAFNDWQIAVMKSPAAIKFTLRPLNLLFSGDQASAVAEALKRYVNGAILATANSDYTPGRGPGGGNFTTSSMIEVNGTILKPDPPVTPPTPAPEKYVHPVSGYQVAIIDGSDFSTIQSHIYYTDFKNWENRGKIFDTIMADVNKVTKRGYLCVVAGFGNDLKNYPSQAFTDWLTSCGASLSGWETQKGRGPTEPPGQASYVCIGRQGLLPGNAVESFAYAQDWADRPWMSTVDVSGLALLYAEGGLRQLAGRRSFASLAAAKHGDHEATVLSASRDKQEKIEA